MNFTKLNRATIPEKNSSILLFDEKKCSISEKQRAFSGIHRNKICSIKRPTRSNHRISRGFKMNLKVENICNQCRIDLGILLNGSNYQFRNYGSELSRFWPIRYLLQQVCKTDASLQQFPQKVVKFIGIETKKLPFNDFASLLRNGGSRTRGASEPSHFSGYSNKTFSFKSSATPKKLVF